MKMDQSWTCKLCFNDILDVSEINENFASSRLLCASCLNTTESIFPSSNCFEDTLCLHNLDNENLFGDEPVESVSTQVSEISDEDVCDVEYLESSSETEQNQNLPIFGKDEDHYSFNDNKKSERVRIYVDENGNFFDLSKLFHEGKWIVNGPVAYQAIEKFYKLICNLCNTLFSNLKSLFDHYIAKHKKRGYIICCGNKMYSKRTLSSHMIIHLQPDAFSCKICHRSMSSPYSLRAHLKKHTKLSKHTRFKCDLCNKMFSKELNLKYHAKIHESHKRKYICKNCGKKYLTQISYKNHMALCHNENGYLCSKCGLLFDSYANIEAHKTTHEDFSDVSCNFTCIICNKVLKNKVSLQSHKRTHSDTVFECDVCHFYTKYKMSLIVHMKNKHSNDHQFSCTTCHKAFKIETKLNRHRCKYSKSYQFSCSLCNKGFVLKSNFLKHEKHCITTKR